MVLRSGGISEIFGWHVRRATVDWQVYLCAGNGAMNCQPPRALHPEPTLSTSAASQASRLPRVQTAYPLVLHARVTPTRAVAAGRFARLNPQTPQSPCSP